MWLRQCILVKSDEKIREFVPLYIFPLNPDYVAARSLRSVYIYKQKRTTPKDLQYNTDKRKNYNYNRRTIIGGQDYLTRNVQLEFKINNFK